MTPESEAITPKNSIDQQLTRLGWVEITYHRNLNFTFYPAMPVCEYPTSSSQADYALFVDGN
jgi:hypothetical protein